MEKRYKKGFMLAETITVSVVVLTALIVIYTQFVSINRSYQNSFRYNTVDKLYAVNNILEYIKTEKINDLVSKLTDDYIDITDCSMFTEFKYCGNLLSNLNVKQVLFTKEDTTGLEKVLKDYGIVSEEMGNYIKVLGVDKEVDRYRLIVEFNDNTFASLKTDKIEFEHITFNYTVGNQKVFVPNGGI